MIGLSSYVLWGILPMYWKQLLAVQPYEILANRIYLSLIFVGLLFLCTGRGGELRSELQRVWQDKRLLLTMVASGAVVTMNWGIYIWAVNNGHIMDSSLGYYINPLINVCFGVVLFGERLSKLTWVAVGCAVLGVCLMIVRMGIFPWIALAIATTFAVYGVLKKKVKIGVQAGLFIETLAVTPLALAYVYYRSTLGLAAYQTADALSLWILATTGIITATPLMMFAYAAKNIPLSTLGFLQYASPTISLLLGIFVYGENFTLEHLYCFGVIWVGLLLFTYDQVIRK